MAIGIAFSSQSGRSENPMRLPGTSNGRATNAFSWLHSRMGFTVDSNCNRCHTSRMQKMTPKRAKLNIAENLQRILSARGMNTLELVRLTKEPQNTIYAIVRGESEPRAAVLASIAEALGVTVDEILQNPKKIPQSA